jgi:hypothetical protein
LPFTAKFQAKVCPLFKKGFCKHFQREKAKKRRRTSLLMKKSTTNDDQKECLRLFEEAYQQKQDTFLNTCIRFLDRNCKVQVFHKLCTDELERVGHERGEPIPLPYGLQTGWKHNIALAESMVAWVLQGRQGYPQQKPKSKSKPKSGPKPRTATAATLATTQSDPNLVTASFSSGPNQAAAATAAIPVFVVKLTRSAFVCDESSSNATLNLKLMFLPQNSDAVSIHTLDPFPFSYQKLFEVCKPYLPCSSSTIPAATGRKLLSADDLLAQLKDCTNVTNEEEELDSPDRCSHWHPLEKYQQQQLNYQLLMSLSGVVLLHSNDYDTAYLFFCNLVHESVLKKKILATVWSMMEDVLGLQRGSGPAWLESHCRSHQQQLPIPPSMHVTEDKLTLSGVNNSIKKEPTIYPSQLDIGRKLFDVISQAHCYNKYDGADFRILVPPRVTLTKQTQERLIHALWSLLIPRGHAHDVLSTLVKQTYAAGQSILNAVTRFDPTNDHWKFFDAAKAQLNQRVLTTCMFRDGVANDDFRQLEKAIFQQDPITGKRKLMVIIHDESHWGIHKNQQVDILFNGAEHANGSNPNPRNPLCEPNVVVLHVSATGWNFDVANVPHKVISWKTCPPGYVSAESYTKGNNQNKVLVANEFDSLIDFYRNSNPNMDPDIAKILPSIVLMVDYAMGFLYAAGQIQPVSARAVQGRMLPTKHMQRIIAHMMTASSSRSSSSSSAASTDTILVRLQKGGVQQVFAQWIKLFRSLLPSQCLTPHQPHQRCPDNVRRYKVVCPSSTTESELDMAGESFETALQGHHSICIVVEKARMGDTIPGISFFDLRARYQSNSSSPGSGSFSSSYTSFLQDVGRCFGYREIAPTMILSQAGFNILSGNTHHVDKFLARTEKPIHELPQIVDLARSGGGGENHLLPNNQSMFKRILLDIDDHKVLNHIKSNRFLLLARPQCGKTGAFIHCLSLILRDKAALGDLVKTSSKLEGIEL